MALAQTGQSGLRSTQPAEGHRSSRAACRRREALLAFSRIIRQRLLLRQGYWINVRPVELRCESTWRCSFGRRDFGQGFFGQSFSGLSLRAQRPRTQSSRVRNLITNGRRPSIRSWAYSSIGQSPRLITGLFLVRTQVGPLSSVLARRVRECFDFLWPARPLLHGIRFEGSRGFEGSRTNRRARMRGARGLWEAVAGRMVARGSRSWSIPQQHGNEEPTYL
jgi:hypothetical protein